MPIISLNEDIPRAELVTVIRSIYKLADKYGIEKLADVLSKENIDPVRDIIVDEIMSKTCRSYKISRQILIYSLKKGTPAEARMMCFVLIKKFLRLSDKKIGDYFDKSQKFVNRMWNLFESMNPKIKAHKDFLIRFEEIDGEIFQFFKSVMAKHKIKSHGRKQ